jgi:hypothetical protein
MRSRGACASARRLIGVVGDITNVLGLDGAGGREHGNRGDYSIIPVK